MIEIEDELTQEDIAEAVKILSEEYELMEETIYKYVYILKRINIPAVFFGEVLESIVSERSSVFHNHDYEISLTLEKTFQNHIRDLYDETIYFDDPEIEKIALDEFEYEPCRRQRR